MVRLAFSFVAGVGATLLVLASLGTFDEIETKPSNAEPAPYSYQDGEDSPHYRVNAGSDEAHASEPVAPDRSTDLRLQATESREETLQRLLREALEKAEEYGAELESIKTTSRRAEDPVVSPLPLGSEFDWLAESDRFTAYDEIQRELIDPQWAATTEQQLTSYFQSRPDILETYGFPQVSCRTQRCAVTFVAYGIDEADYITPDRWRSLVSDFFDDEWAIQFRQGLAGGLSQVMSRNEDGATTIYWALRAYARPWP